MLRRLVNAFRFTVAVLLCAAFLLAGLGVGISIKGPLGVSTPAQQAYLCADHQCGCQSVEDCQTHCCYFPDGRADVKVAVDPSPAADDDATIHMVIKSRSCTGFDDDFTLSHLCFLDSPCGNIQRFDLEPLMRIQSPAISAPTPLVLLLSPPPPRA